MSPAVPAAQLRGAAFIPGCPAQVARPGLVCGGKLGKMELGRTGAQPAPAAPGGSGTQLWCGCSRGGGRSSSPNPQPRGVLLQLSTDLGCLYEPSRCEKERLSLEEGACSTVALKKFGLTLSKGEKKKKSAFAWAQSGFSKPGRCEDNAPPRPGLLLAASSSAGAGVAERGTPLAQACCNPASREARGDAPRAAPCRCWGLPTPGSAPTTRRWCWLQK